MTVAKTWHVATPKLQPKPAAQAQLPLAAQPGLVSPYDGTSPTGLPGGMLPGGVLPGGQMPNTGGMLGAGAAKPQMNATNQTGLAPNGDVNQTVTNQNAYTNKYYNIIMPYGQGGGGYNPFNPGLQGNSFIDPASGVMYVQQDTGIVGWFKRLFRGY